MEPLTEALPTALFLAATVTKLVDFVRNIFKYHLENHKWASILFAGVIGIVLAWLTNFNLFAGLNKDVLSKPLAVCINGLLLTGGSGGIHELFDLMSSRAKRESARRAWQRPENGGKRKKRVLPLKVFQINQSEALKSLKKEDTL